MLPAFPQGTPTLGNPFAPPPPQHHPIVQIPPWHHLPSEEHPMVPPTSRNTPPSILTCHSCSLNISGLPPLHPWLSQSPLSPLPALGSLCTVVVPAPGVLPAAPITLFGHVPTGLSHRVPLLPQHPSLLPPTPRTPQGPLHWPGSCLFPPLSPLPLCAAPRDTLPSPWGPSLCLAPLQHLSPVPLLLRDPIVTSRLSPSAGEHPCVLPAALPCTPLPALFSSSSITPPQGLPPLP